MVQVSSAAARENFAEIMNNAIYKHERTILTRRGKGVVAIVPLSDLELLEKLEEIVDVRDAESAIREIKDHGTVSFLSIRKDLDL
jgi:prevent-host-death family protein